MAPIINIVKDSNTSLIEQKNTFLKDTKGVLREILESIWNEYVLFGRKVSYFPAKYNIFTSTLEELGFKCCLKIKEEATFFVVSWE